MSKLLFAAVAGALGTMLVGGLATAAIPNDAKVVEGCYLKVGGILRVIDTAKGQKCLPNLETALNWNQAGSRETRDPLATRDRQETRA